MLWAAGSGDFYQIHYDKDFAQATGLKGLIVHGGESSFLGQLLHDWAGEQGRVRRFGCALSRDGRAEPGHSLWGVVTKTISKDGKNVVELDVWTEKPDGKKDVYRARRGVTLPSRN